MTISKDDVRHVATLARLRLSVDEVDLFTGQLGQILEHAGLVAAVNVGDIEPTAHAVPLKNVWREDKTRPSLSKEDALANAPEVEDGAFKVPKII